MPRVITTIVALLMPVSAQAQVQVDLSSVFTGDYVRNTGDSVDASIDASGFNLVSEGVAGTGLGLPSSGQFGATARHPDIQLAATENNSGNNGILLLAGASVTIQPPGQRYRRLQIYSLATEGSASVRVTVNYASGSPSTTTLTVSDWFDDPPALGTFYVLDGMDRFSRTNGTVERRTDAALFGFDVMLDTSRAVQSLLLEHLSTGTQRWVILGMTGESLAVSAVDDVYLSPEDSLLVIQATQGLLANDDVFDGGTGTARTLTGPAQGRLTLSSDGGFEYRPNANYFGADQFSYELRSTTGATDRATVRLNIEARNDPPVARDDRFGLLAPGVTQALNVLANDDDGPDVGESLRVVGVEAADQGGDVQLMSGVVLYTPRAEFRGEERFSYRIDDGTPTSTAGATVTVDVGLPAGFPDLFTIDEDTPLISTEGVLANDMLPSNAAFGARVQDDVVHGRLTMDPDGAFQYVPDANYFGEDGFSYVITTSGGAMGLPIPTRIEILPINDPPTARPDSLEAAAGTTERVEVLANDSFLPDAQEDLRVIAVEAPSAGGSAEVTPDGAAVLYTPAEGFAGVETVVYRIDDGDPSSTAMSVITATVSAARADAGIAADSGAPPPEDAGMTGGGVDAGVIAMSPEDAGCRCASGRPKAPAFLAGLALFGALLRRRKARGRISTGAGRL